MSNTPLPTNAALRKTEILADLQSALARRRIRRRATRTAAATLPLALAITAATLSSRPPALAPTPILPPTPVASSSPPHLPTSSPPQTYASIRVQTISDDPTVSTRLQSPGDLARVRLISDDELLSDLAAAGRPSGLLRTPTKAIVVSNALPKTEPTQPEGVPATRGI